MKITRRQLALAPAAAAVPLRADVACGADDGAKKIVFRVEYFWHKAANGNEGICHKVCYWNKDGKPEQGGLGSKNGKGGGYGILLNRVNNGSTNLDELYVRAQGFSGHAFVPPFDRKPPGMRLGHAREVRVNLKPGIFDFDGWQAEIGLEINKEKLPAGFIVLPHEDCPVYHTLEHAEIIIEC